MSYLMQGRLRSSFPLRYQHDSKDCGPTCLQMIHTHFGGDIPITKMRELCDLNIDGVSMQGMATAAEHLNMTAMATRVSPDVLDDMPVPFIAHWLQEHFVVVTEVWANKVKVADPEIGFATYSRTEFIRRWLGSKVFGEIHARPEGSDALGAVLLLAPDAQFQPEKREKAALSSIYNFRSFLKEHARRLYVIALIFPVIMAITIALPLIMQRVIDQSIGRDNMELLTLLLLGYFTLLVSRNVIGTLRDLILLRVGALLSIEIVHGFMQHLLKLDIGFFERRSLGDLIQRQHDHRRIEQFLTTQSLPTFFSLLTFAAFAVMLAGYDGYLLVVVAVTATLTTLWIAKFRRHRRTFDLQQFELEGAVQDHTVEIMSSVVDLKAFGMTRQKTLFYRSLLERRYATTLRALRLDEAQSVGALLLMDAGEILALLLAGRAVINGGASIGDFVAVMYILGQLRGPLARMVPFFQSAQDARLSLHRLQSLAEENKEPAHCAMDDHFRQMQASAIRLENVTFRYNPLHQSNVLKGISFSIPKGKKTAIVGASGSGKSTLIKLLTKSHAPTEGAIHYADQDLSQVSPDVWRQRIGQVLQEGTIFNSTITYNITLSHAEPDQKLLDRAIGSANVDEFLPNLPLGLSTSIGRAGWQLSTGQKQRVLIARALYRDPEILIFDEATSALDSNNESEIITSLSEVFSGRTSIVISHRLSTICDADHIVVLKDGMLVEQGTHADLIAQHGTYVQMFKRQLDSGQR